MTIHLVFFFRWDGCKWRSDEWGLTIPIVRSREDAYAWRDSNDRSISNCGAESRFFSDLDKSTQVYSSPKPKWACTKKKSAHHSVTGYDLSVFFTVLKMKKGFQGLFKFSDSFILFFSCNRLRIHDRLACLLRLLPSHHRHPLAHLHHKPGLENIRLLQPEIHRLPKRMPDLFVV